jgi:RES domain-containing protein
MANLTLWRLTKKTYADSAFSGEGARLYGGRFNSKGTRVVYTSEHLALALVETLAGLTDYDDLYQYVFFSVQIADTAAEDLASDDLPVDWNSRPPAREAQKVGDAWIQERRSLALRVPSVVVPYSHNVLLNPEHDAFDDLDIGAPEELPVDERLVE